MRQGQKAGPSGGPSCVPNAPDAPGMGPPCHLGPWPPCTLSSFPPPASLYTHVLKRFPFMSWTLPTSLSQALPPGNATGDLEAQDTVLVRGHTRL